MPTERPAFTIGIEEEYLLVDPESRDLLRDPPDSLMKQCEEVLGPQVGHEFLRAQVEVGTKVSKTVAEAREDLVMLRRGLRDVAERNGIAYIAASTHPFADWAEQQVTDKARYQMLAKDLQAVARPPAVCGEFHETASVSEAARAHLDLDEDFSSHYDRRFGLVVSSEVSTVYRS